MQAEKAEVINTFLFVAGINTLLQTAFGTRLPVVTGPSYAFIIPIISIALSRRFSDYVEPHEVGSYINLLPSQFFRVRFDSKTKWVDDKRKSLEMLCYWKRWVKNRVYCLLFVGYAEFCVLMTSLICLRTILEV